MARGERLPWCRRARRPRRRRRARSRAAGRPPPARARRPARPPPRAAARRATSASVRRCRIRTAATAPITAISAPGQANTLVAPSGPRVHRDVGTAVGLAGHQRDPGHRRLGERVQQLRAAADHAVPLLADSGQVAGNVHERRPAARRRRRTSGRTWRPSRPRSRPGSRPAAAGCWRPRRPCGRQPAERGDDVRRPARVQLDARLVEHAVDQRVHVVGASWRLRQQRRQVEVAEPGLPVPLPSPPGCWPQQQARARGPWRSRRRRSAATTCTTPERRLCGSGPPSRSHVDILAGHAAHHVRAGDEDPALVGAGSPGRSAPGRRRRRPPPARGPPRSAAPCPMRGSWPRRPGRPRAGSRRPRAAGRRRSARARSPARRSRSRGRRRSRWPRSRRCPSRRPGPAGRWRTRPPACRRSGRARSSTPVVSAGSSSSRVPASKSASSRACGSRPGCGRCGRPWPSRPAGAVAAADRRRRRRPGSAGRQMVTSGSSVLARLALRLR